METQRKRTRACYATWQARRPRSSRFFRSTPVHEAVLTREQLLEKLLTRGWQRADADDLRVARMLDGIGQQSTGVKSRLTSLRALAVEGSAAERWIYDLDEVLSRVGTLGDSLGALARELLPTAVETMGLPTAIRWQSLSSEDRLGITVRCLTSEVSASAEHSLALVRVLRDALDNVSLHAGVLAADVLLERRNHEAVLSVVDAGVGFNLKRSAGAAGLHEMRERLSSVGGSLRVVSRPGSGTSIVAAVPALAEPDAGLERSAKDPIRVLAADDHPIVRRGLRQVLGEENDAMLEEVGTIPALRESLGRRRADVLVLEISMAGGAGLEILEEIHARYPKLPVLVLTNRGEDDAGVRALASGARGYLTKDAAPELVAEAVRALHRGQRFVSSRLEEAHANYAQVNTAGSLPHQSLSARELTILVLIASGASTVTIARQLHISPKTVGTYRARLFKKMGMASTALLTRYVIENGLSGDSLRAQAISIR